MHRCLIALVAGLAGLAAAAPDAARAQSLCQHLAVPDQLGLGCTDATDAGGRAVVQPLEGTFRALSRLSLRPLDRAADGLAWSDPEAWLERQMIVDLDGVADTVGELASDPDSPFGSEMFRRAIEVLISGLEGVSRLPLAACGEGPSETEVTCRFGVEGVGLVLRVMLLGEDEARYAVNIRTFNEQRLRHFTAIANSFDVP